MFVKKIPLWKIKRFIKGCIRTILFFVIISSFVFCCSANPSYTYADFDTFVDNGFVQFHLRNGNSQIVRTGEFGPSSNLNQMDFTIDNSSAFNSVLMTIEDSNNVNQSFKSRDSLVLVHDIVIQLSGSSPGENYAKKFTLDINYTDNDTFVNGELSFRYDEVLKSFDYITTSWGSIVRFSVDLNTVLPNINGTITSIDYHFYDIVANGYRFVISPSAIYDGTYIENESLIYYVGDSQNAPIYKLPDDKPLTDLEDTEGALLKDFENVQEDFFKRFHQPNLTDFESWANNFWSQQGGSFGNWLAAASGLFSIIWDLIPWHIRNLIQFLLVFGILGFILNLISRLVKE